MEEVAKEIKFSAKNNKIIDQLTGELLLDGICWDDKERVIIEATKENINEADILSLDASNTVISVIRAKN